MEVNDFKEMQHVDRIEIKRNENTGKCFFEYGIETGPVSDVINEGKLTSPVISQVCSPQTGDTFYLMHQRGVGGVKVLATM